MTKTLKNNVLAILIAAISSHALATENQPETNQLSEDLGYFYGYSFGNMLRDGKSTDVDLERLLQGLKDAIDGVPP